MSLALLTLFSALTLGLGRAQAMEDLRIAGEATPSVEALLRQWQARPPVDLFDEAVERIRHGDYGGAMDRLRVLEGQTLHPELAARVQFELGRALELSHRCAEAVPRYAEAAGAPGATPVVVADARFRSSLCLSDLGEHKAAKKALKSASKAPAVGALGLQKIAIEAGVQALRRGRERRGEPALRAALQALPDDEAAWVRSRGLHALQLRELDAAAAIGFRGDERAAAALKERVVHISAAEDLVVQIVKLREPELVLAGLTAMGDGYQSLHDDLLAAPAPPRLTDDQEQLYRATLLEQVGVLHRKAVKYWELGLQEGLNVGWQGPELEALRARLGPTG